MISEADSRWEANRQAALKRRLLKEEAVEYKGGKCEICGYTGFPSVFDFHHLDPAQKDYSISQRVVSFAALKEELDKCALLCCRCHREVHEGLHPSYLVLDTDSTGWSEEPDFTAEVEYSDDLG